MTSDGFDSSHAVRMTYSFHLPVRSRVADSRLNVLAQSCDIGIGLLKNAMHILEFNIVSGSIIIKCRDVFRWAAKLDFEWGTIKMLCFHHVVDVVDDHTGSCDQLETENRVHAHLGSGGNNKRGWASVLGEIW